MRRYFGLHRIQIGSAAAPDQILRLFQRFRLPQQQAQFNRLPRLQSHHPLQSGAGVERGSGPARQDPAQPMWIGHIATHPHHLGPIPGPAGHLRANIGKGDTARKCGAPRIAGQHRASIRIHLRRHKPCCRTARRA